jgi:hypothetical protein
MKRIEIYTYGNSASEPIVLESAEAGYSVKQIGNQAYISAWKKANNGVEETLVVPLNDLRYLRFTLEE